MSIKKPRINELIVSTQTRPALNKSLVSSMQACKKHMCAAVADICHDDLTGEVGGGGGVMTLSANHSHICNSFCFKLILIHSD